MKGFDNYYQFHLTSAKFYEQTGKFEQAESSYRVAMRLSDNDSVKKFVEKKLSRVS